MTLLSGLKRLFVCLLFLVQYPGFTQTALAAEQVFEIGGQTIAVAGELNGFALTIQQAVIEDGLNTALLSLARAVPAAPPHLTLRWRQPSHDIAGIWTPDIAASRTIPPDWREIGTHLKSMLTHEAPVFTLFGSDDANRITVALSDAMNPVLLDSRVREEDALIYNSIELFTERHEDVKSYSVELRIDQRNIPYSTALGDVAEWWAGKPGYRPVPVPAVARLPMYSTWYSYHQNIDFDSMLNEARIARKLGLQAIIVDDGWQTLDSSRGYAYAGDWQPERLSRMKEFVDAVHGLGMQAILWYSVPFVGEKSQAYETFAGKFLEHIELYGSYVLDPRYPEVRRYLIEHYKHAVKVWGWDGLKLDFIDRFQTQDDTVLQAIDGRDYASVYEAVDRLMTDVIGELSDINPDIAIEFRQHYIGPKMRTYGNMFRAHDSPNLAFVNRQKIVDLRLLSGNTAVHSDMLMWHYEESVEIAALQLLSVLFSVPQISVRLAEIPGDHFDMIRFYTDYWISNRDVLLDSEFEARSPLLNYPLISGRSEDKRIVALYYDLVVDLTAADASRKEIDIVNAKNSQRIVLDVAENIGMYEVTARDCKGIEQARQIVALGPGVISFDAPVSGLLSLRRVAN